MFAFLFSFDACTVQSELFEITETQVKYAFTCLPKCFLQEDLFKHLQTRTTLFPYTTGLYFTNFILFKEIKYKLWTQKTWVFNMWYMDGAIKSALKIIRIKCSTLTIKLHVMVNTLRFFKWCLAYIILSSVPIYLS